MFEVLVRHCWHAFIDGAVSELRPRLSQLLFSLMKQCQSSAHISVKLRPHVSQLMFNVIAVCYSIVCLEIHK